MKIRWLGIGYLLGAVFDGALSMVAIAFQPLEGVSDTFSSLMLLASGVVFILALLGHLRPRVLFIVPAMLYGCFIVMGVILGVVVVFKSGGQGLPEGFGSHSLREMFPWFGPVDWVLLFILMAVSGVCCYKYLRTIEEPNPVTGAGTSGGGAG